MTIGEEEFRDTADDVLSRPEFAEESKSLVQRGVDWIFERLGDALGTVVGNGGGYIIGYLILAVGFGLAAYFIWRFFPRRRLASGDDGYEIDRTTTVRRSRKQWLAEAAEAEAAGEWDRAVHARYHALTTGLADDEELPSEVSTTSGEHRSAFAMAAGRSGAEGRVQVFNHATDRYEDVWFGGQEAAPNDNESLQDADRRLLEGDR